MCDTIWPSCDGYFERKKQRWLKKGNMTAVGSKNSIGQRDRARMEKNWQEADRIRDELQAEKV